jgi:hypothetical protein
MKETYLSRDFRETAAQNFPSQAKELNAFFDARLNVLLAENADASKEKQYHLKRQILPGIAAYETLQRAMQVPAATWMSVMSQSSTNSAIVIWCIAAAVYERSHTQ